MGYTGSKSRTSSPGQLGLPFAGGLELGARGPELGAGGPALGGWGGASPTTQFVRHPRAKHYRLRVDLSGHVRLTIPRGGSRREAEAFVARHRDWVERQLATISPLVHSDEGEHRALIARAHQELPARVKELAAIHGLRVSRVSIRNQRSRWGSCSRDGHICLNWRLARMPDWIRDYVILHELMHLRRMDHSPQYWNLVAAACPDYRAARTWLRRHARGL